MSKRASRIMALLLIGALGYIGYQGWLFGRRSPASMAGSQVQTNQQAEQNSVAAPTYNIVTLLPPDAIPAIDHPTFVTGEEADKQYQPDELVLGVEINGDARAYSIPFLSGHEIVNDTVGGEPIAVTW